jgi:putative membrane protein
VTFQFYPGHIMNIRMTAASALAAGFLTISAQAQAPSDPQIVGIVVAANQIDINYGSLALTKSHNKQVREFAQQMLS